MKWLANEQDYRPPYFSPLIYVHFLWEVCLYVYVCCGYMCIHLCSLVNVVKRTRYIFLPLKAYSIWVGDDKLWIWKPWCFLPLNQSVTLYKPSILFLMYSREIISKSDDDIDKLPQSQMWNAIWCEKICLAIISNVYTYPQ